MIIDRITAGKTVELMTKDGEHIWLKFDASASLMEHDNRKDSVTELDSFVDGYFKETIKKITEPSNQSKMSKEEHEATDKAFDLLKENLSKIDNMEDAQAYLETTEFKHTIAAKSIVNSKPPKNK